MTLAVVAACRGSHAIGASGSGILDPEKVDPAYASDWQAVRDAQTKDPGGAAVVAAADRLLARSPPLDLRLGAFHAKATQGLQRGDYAAALAAARAGLDEAGRARQSGSLGATEQELVGLLAQVHALAEAEAGDPQAALQSLGALPQDVWGPEFYAASARARERAGDPAGAALACAQWRASVRGGPELTLAQNRLEEALAGLDGATLEAAARKASGTPAAQCLLVRAGREAPEGAPEWVQGCRAAAPSGGTKIAVLLPRTGKLAGLADQQLAAATAALKVLGAGAAAPSLLWGDAGSEAADAKLAALNLIGEGAQVLVGPVGVGNVDAVAELAAASGGRVRLVVPGEGSGGAVGVAPTLEGRAAKLAETVGRLRRTTAVIFAPENSYGKRIVAALEKSLPKNGVTTLKIINYPASTTSFAKLIDPVRGNLKGAAIIAPDQLGRVELLVRQLVRDGVVVDTPGKPGTPVLTTGEGVGPRGLGAGHEVLEGIYVAPVAWQEDGEAPFAEAYAALEGEGPGDQAWLVWRAMSRAWTGALGPPPQAALLRVEGGRLAPAEASNSLTPAERSKARGLPRPG